jgi:hypothetical protein
MVSSQIEHMKYIIVSDELLKSNDWSLVLQLMDDQGIKVLQIIPRPNNTSIVELEGHSLQEDGLYDISVAIYERESVRFERGALDTKYGLIITKS